MTHPTADLAIAQFQHLYDYDPAVIVRAPGRVLLLGSQIEFQECWTIVAALEQAIWVAAGPRPPDGAGFVSIHSIYRQQTAGFPLGPLMPGQYQENWLAYPAGVAWALIERGLPVEGLNLVIASDLPIGAGLGSSQALSVACVLAWQSIGGWALDHHALAECCHRGQSAFLGIDSSPLDYIALLQTQAGCALALDYRTQRWESLPLPPDIRIMLADTGIRDRFHRADLEEREAQVDQGLAWLRERMLGIDTLRDLPPESYLVLQESLPEPMRSRCEHVIGECSRAQAGVHDLRRGDLRAFGAAIQASHRSARDNLECSCQELDLLAKTAWKQPGCYGARLTGDCSAGCVVALVKDSYAQALQRRLGHVYQAVYNSQPTFYTGRPAAAAEIQFYRGESADRLSPLFAPHRSQPSEIF